MNATGTYGIAYLVRGSGGVDGAQLLAYMTTGSCNATTGRFGFVNITTFFSKPFAYPAGQVSLTTADTKLTVCFQAGSGAEVDGYVFGLPVSLRDECEAA